MTTAVAVLLFLWLGSSLVSSSMQTASQSVTYDGRQRTLLDGSSIDQNTSCDALCHTHESLQLVVINMFTEASIAWRASKALIRRMPHGKRPC